MSAAAAVAEESPGPTPAVAGAASLAPAALARVVACVAAAVVLTTAPAQAQLSGRSDLAFDSPESWGMKFGTTLAMFTGFGAPAAVEKGSLELGLEVALVPQVSDEQRRIGFNGTKLEDMNKSRFFARLRARLGIGGDWGATVGVVPPVELGGAKPLMGSVSVGGPIVTTEATRIGVRAYGHLGRIDGDITCDAETVAAGVDPVRNEAMCEAVSDDRLTQRFAGAEVSAAFPQGDWEPHVGVAVNYLDTSFQVDARFNNITSTELLETNGFTFSATAGVSLTVSEAIRIAAEAFYSPLSVVRPPSTESGSDGLFNVRAMVSYQVR